MLETAPKAELLRALGRLVRGLSALFWGLPLTLLVCVKSAMTEWLRPLGLLPPVLTTVLLFYGLVQLGFFQRQERIWTDALDRAKMLALINIGLSPFIYFWSKLPIPFYSWMVGLLALSGILFLFNLNRVLQRLTAMLPDETLRMETQLFTTLNLYLLCAILLFFAAYVLLQRFPTVPAVVAPILFVLEVGRQYFFLFLVLLPVALTMTLIWKIKEVVFASVFGPE